MTKRKKLQELTIKDNFMFGAVMVDEELCREFLELALGFKIARVTVSKEKSIVYHPEYKGVRLDVVADDENRTHYNVEMQVLRKKHLGKRSRYYHSQIDMELLLAGLEYGQLPDSYVIFVCDFDPFYKKRYRYTFDTVCKEDDTICLEDGNHTVFLSTCGENEDIGSAYRETELMAERTKYLKENPEGVSIMCKAMEEMRNNASEEKAISIAKNLLQIGSLTYEQIAKATELTLAKVQELAGQLAG